MLQCWNTETHLTSMKRRSHCRHQPQSNMAAHTNIRAGSCHREAGGAERLRRYLTSEKKNKSAVFSSMHHRIKSERGGRVLRHFTAQVEAFPFKTMTMTLKVAHLPLHESAFSLLQFRAERLQKCEIRGWNTAAA